MKKQSIKSGAPPQTGANVRVTRSGSADSFRAYRAPGKKISTRLLEKIGSGVSFLLEPSTVERSNLRVGNSVRTVKKPFG